MLDEARWVFLAKGFSATSLDDLAAATGLNRPSLYAAFGDKERLYVLALQRHAGGLLAGLEAILAQDMPIAKRLAQVYAAAIDVYTRPPVARGCMLVNTATVESPSHPGIAAAAADLLARFEGAFERAFARAIKVGELSRSPAAAVRARMAQALLHTLSVRARVGTSLPELKSIASSVIPMMCAELPAAHAGKRKGN